MVKTAASLPFINPRQANAVTHKHIAPRLLKTYPAVKDKEYKEYCVLYVLIYINGNLFNDTEKLEFKPKYNQEKYRPMSLNCHLSIMQIISDLEICLQVLL